MSTETENVRKTSGHSVYHGLPTAAASGKRISWENSEDVPEVRNEMNEMQIFFASQPSQPHLEIYGKPPQVAPSHSRSMVDMGADPIASWTTIIWVWQVMGRTMYNNKQKQGTHRYLMISIDYEIY